MMAVVRWERVAVPAGTPGSGTAGDGGGRIAHEPLEKRADRGRPVRQRHPVVRARDELDPLRHRPGQVVEPLRVRREVVGRVVVVARGDVQHGNGDTPGRTGKDESLLRVFFLWLLDAGEAASYLDREAAYQRQLLAKLERIAASTVIADAKDETYWLALDYGLRVTRTRIEWAEDSARDIRPRSTSPTTASAAPHAIAAADQPRPKPPAASSQANETSPR